jgi:hypothetical protein
MHLDGGAVLFGAATHDIGKTARTAELSGPGSAHEQAGRQLLLNHGISPELARFAATHTAWTESGITIEDLLVSVADKIWKNKRVPDLEDLVVTRLAEVSGRPHWEEFSPSMTSSRPSATEPTNGWPSNRPTRYTGHRLDGNRSVSGCYMSLSAHVLPDRRNRDSTPDSQSGARHHASS